MTVQASAGNGPLERITMTIDQMTSAGDVGGPAANQRTNPLGQDAFMKLLLTQLQHQDPTAPQADGEFLAQLAQFSTLEQLQAMNAKLDVIAGMFTAADSAAATSEVQ